MNDTDAILDAVADAIAGGDAADTADRTEVRPWQPFPLGTLPPDLAHWIELKAAATGTPAEGWVLPTLCAVSVAAGDSRRVTACAHWTREPLIVWAALVAGSGEGKSIAPRTVFRRLRQADADWAEQHARAMSRHAGEAEAHKADLAAWRTKRRRGEPDAGEAPTPPEPPRRRVTLVTDTTIEALAGVLVENPRGVLVHRDELSAWMASFERYTAGSDRPAWLEAFEGGSATIRRVGRGAIDVPSAWAAIFGSIQPDILRTDAGDGDLASGLLPRFVLCWPPPGDGRMDPDAPAPDDTPIERLIDAMLAMEAGPDGPADLPLTAEARARFVQWRNDRVPEVRAPGGAMSAALSKGAAIALRLAALLELVWAGTDAGRVESVGLRSVERGIEVAEWAGYEWCRCCDLLFAESRASGRRDRGLDLVAWIREQGGEVTPREVRNAHRRAFETVAEATHALDRLKAAGHGDWTFPPPGDAGGRPSRRFRLAG